MAQQMNDDDEDEGQPLQPNQAPLITQADLDQAQAQKAKLALIGKVGDNLANRSSFGNFFLGQANPHQDVSGFTDRQASLVDQGIANKKLLQDQAMKAPAMQYMQQAMDKGSDISKFATQSNQAQLDRVKQSLFPNNPQGQASIEDMKGKLAGLSAYEQDQLLDKTGMSKLMGQESMTADKLGTMMASLKQRQGNQDRNYDLKVQSTGAKEGGSIDRDPIISNLSQRQLQILIDKHTIESGGTINSTVAAELSNGLANAIGGGKGAGLTQSEKQELNSLQGDLKTLQGYVSGVPQEKWTPEQRAFAAQTMQRAYNAFGVAMYHRAQGLARSKQSYSNPTVQNQIATTVEGYNPQNDTNSGQPNPQPTNGGDSGGMIPSAQAQAPQTKVINGSTYVKVQGGWKRMQ